MQCVSRAGAEADLGDLEAVAHRHQPVLVGELSPSNASSQWPPCSSGPMIGMRRTMRQPGWFAIEQERRQAAARIVGRARDQDEVLRASPRR